jgi:hypothetical protein
MEALLPRNSVSKDTAVVTLADKLGISRTRTIQFLNLRGIPADLRARLMRVTSITEVRLRAIVQMDTARMRVMLGQFLGMGTMAKAG